MTSNDFSFTRTQIVGGKMQGPCSEGSGQRSLAGSAGGPSEGRTNGEGEGGAAGAAEACAAELLKLQQQVTLGGGGGGGARKGIVTKSKFECSSGAFVLIMFYCLMFLFAVVLPTATALDSSSILYGSMCS